MEASAVPRPAPSGVSLIASPRLLRLATDAHLVTLIRQGRRGAFEAAYDRHHRSILSFCRHMLGDAQEAEDVVQQTFLAAYNDLVGSDKPILLRAWLFTIARNRCYTILRSRREHPSAELDEQLTEGLATQVQRRQDLRDLVVDMQHLPADQRAALVLAELDALSHEQIGEVLGVPRNKVKALVFQARESLTASRAAREADCTEIREQLSNLRGGGLRRGHIRRHLRECAGCRAYRREVDRQRRQFALLLPVIPAIALKQGVMGGVLNSGAHGATAVGLGGGGAIASSALKGGALKGLVGAGLAGLGAATTIVAVHGFQPPSPLHHHKAPATSSASTPLIAAVPHTAANGQALLADSQPDPESAANGSSTPSTGSSGSVTRRVIDHGTRGSNRLDSLHNLRGAGNGESSGGAAMGGAPTEPSQPSLLSVGTSPAKVIERWHPSQPSRPGPAPPGTGNGDGGAGEYLGGDGAGQGNNPSNSGAPGGPRGDGGPAPGSGGSGGSTGTGGDGLSGPGSGSGGGSSSGSAGGSSSGSAGGSGSSSGSGSGPGSGGGRGSVGTRSSVPAVHGR
jgi:RNA polymerase sigma factor (sigma-70 family)